MWSKILESAILGGLKSIFNNNNKAGTYKKSIEIDLIYYCVLYLTKFLWNTGISESISRYFFLFWSTVHTFQVSHLKIFFSIKPSCMNGNYSSLERHFFGCLINNFFENFVHLSSKYYDEPKKFTFIVCHFCQKMMIKVSSYSKNVVFYVMVKNWEICVQSDKIFFSQYPKIEKIIPKCFLNILPFSNSTLIIIINLNII